MCDCRLEASRKQELDGADSCNKPASGFCPGASGKEPGPAGAPSFHPGETSSREPTSTLCPLLLLENCEIRNECYCKPLSVR